MFLVSKPVSLSIQVMVTLYAAASLGFYITPRMTSSRVCFSFFFLWNVFRTWKIAVNYRSTRFRRVLYKSRNFFFFNVIKTSLVSIFLKREFVWRKLPTTNSYFLNVLIIKFRYYKIKSRMYYLRKLRTNAFVNCVLL